MCWLARVCFFCWFPVLTVQAGEWIYVKPELGLGFSDNVYQDDQNKKSDSFTWIQALAKYGLAGSSLTGKLNLSLYSRESENNSASYYLKHSTPLEIQELDLTLGVGGFSYFKSDLGSTDEAFNHAYLTAYVSKTIAASDKFEIILEPGLKLASYPQLNNRYDVIGFFRADALWTLNAQTQLNPYLEFGMLASNQNYYNKSYLDLGITGTNELTEHYKATADFFLRNSSYPNRVVSDILQVPNRRGRSTSAAVDANESISLMQIAVSLVRTDLDREISIGMSYANENSLSRLEAFKELQILSSLKWTFK